MLYENTRNDFFIIENKASIEHLQYMLDIYGFSRFKCFSLLDQPNEILIKYFIMMYKSCSDYEIINNCTYKLKYNTELSQRHLVINSESEKDDNYLEIGVETGYTFNNVHFVNKTGVDPSPAFISDNLVIKTSDDFFENLDSNTRFNIVFIDGLHQCEQVVRDINNSIRFLNENGKILVDDIIPLNYDEQLKIPKKHYYDDTVLKTMVPWTGDVWKPLYHILLFYSEHIEFKYYYHLYYRGVAVLKIKSPFQISDSEIEHINKYDYVNDFIKYTDLLINYSNVK